jgi:hypothetical protein
MKVFARLTKIEKVRLFLPTERTTMEEGQAWIDTLILYQVTGIL